MQCGGNKKLAKLFEEYDLSDQSNEYKFKTVVAAYYRRQLKALVAGEVFDEQPPTLEYGREPELQDGCDIFEVAEDHLALPACDTTTMSNNSRNSKVSLRLSGMTEKASAAKQSVVTGVKRAQTFTR